MHTQVELDHAVTVQSSILSLALSAATQELNRAIVDPQKVSEARAIRPRPAHPARTQQAPRLLADRESIAKADTLERQVWQQRGYPGIEGYEQYAGQSRIYAVFCGTDCVGMTRMFDGNPSTPPFLNAMPIYDPQVKTALMAGCDAGTVEELGTTAVARAARAIKTAVEMWRLAYRTAMHHGVESWGIIMEPERVEIMRNRYGFPFRQLGPAIDYQGGMCAAHLMRLHDIHTHMRLERPDYYRWFVLDPL